MEEIYNWTEIAEIDNPMRLARVIDVLKGSMKCKKIAEEIYYSQRNLSRIQRLNELIPEFQEMVENGEIGLMKGYLLSSLTEDQQRMMYEQFKHQILKYNRKFVEKKVKEYRKESLS